MRSTVLLAALLSILGGAAFADGPPQPIVIQPPAVKTTGTMTPGHCLEVSAAGPPLVVVDAGLGCNVVPGSHFEDFQADALAGSLSANFSFFRYNGGSTVNSSGNLVTLSASTPRLEFNPLTLQPAGLRIEPQAPQYISTQTMTSWSTSAVTVASGGATGPDGTASMYTVTEGSGSALHVVFLQFTSQPTTFQICTFLKASTRRYVQVAVDNSPTATFGAVFDTQNWGAPVSGSSGSGSIISAATGLVKGPNGTHLGCFAGSWPTPSGAVYLEIAGLNSSAYVAPPNQLSAGSDTFFVSLPQFVPLQGAVNFGPLQGESTVTLPVTGAIGNVRAADMATFTVPAGVGAIKYNFPDGTSQTVPVVPGLPMWLPRNLTEPVIASMDVVKGPVPQDFIACPGDSIANYTNASTGYCDLVAAYVQSTFGYTPATLTRGLPGAGFLCAEPYSGIGTGTMSSDAAAYIDPIVAAVPNAKLIVEGGINDMFTCSNSEAATLAAFQAYINARITAGWKPANIFVLPVLPGSGVNDTTRATFTTDELSFCNSGVKCTVIRLDQVSGLGTNGSQTGANYGNDELHPSNAGQAAIAVAIEPVVYPN